MTDASGTPRAWEAGRPSAVGSSAMLETADWLVTKLPEMGVPVPAGSRLPRARSLIEEVHRRALVLTPDAPDLLGRVSDAQRTIAEFYIITRGIRRRPSAFTPTVRDKVAQMLGGTDSEATDTKTLNRDTQFELYVYALLLMGGAAVRIAEPDLRFQYGVEDVGIAVKRLSSPKKLKKRVLAAASQIERTGGPGFIAVNVDRFVVDAGGPTENEDVIARGRRYSEKLSALHQLTDRFSARPQILGIMNFGYSHHWEFDGPIPRYSAASFRQTVRLSDTEADDELAERFFGGLSARIDNALREL